MTKNRGVKAERAMKKAEDPTFAAKATASAERLANLPKIPGQAGKHSKKRQEGAEAKVIEWNPEIGGEDSYMVIDPEQGVHLSQLCLKSFRSKFQSAEYNYHVKRVPIPDSMKKSYNNRNRAQQFFTVVGRTVQGLMAGLAKCKVAVKAHNDGVAGGGDPAMVGDDAAPVPIDAYNGDIHHVNHHEVQAQNLHEGGAVMAHHEAGEDGDIVPNFIPKPPGTKKRKWSDDEELALIAGMERHGLSKEPWKAILNDPEYHILLEQNWTNVNLFDKYRLLIKSGKVPARPPSDRAERSSVAKDPAMVADGEEGVQKQKKMRKSKPKKDDEDDGEEDMIDDGNMDDEDDDEGFITSNRKTKGLKNKVGLASETEI